MKKSNKVLAILVLALMTFTLCVSAAAPESVAETFKADTAIKMEMTTTAGESVKSGDTFDVSVKVGLANSTDYVATGFLNISINYDPTVFSVAVSSAQPTKKAKCSYTDDEENEWYYMARNASGILNTSAVESDTNWQAIYSQNLNHLLSTSNNFVTYTFTVKDGVKADSSDIFFANCAMNNTSGTATKQIADNSITANGPITINISNGGSGSTDITLSEETFGDEDSFTSNDMTSGNVVIDADNKIAMQEGGKIYTYFNKNATGKTLTGGTYGIDVKIGEHIYRFCGKENVGATQSWAIKLIVPKGTFEEVSHAVTIDTTNPNTVTVFGVDE